MKNTNNKEINGYILLTSTGLSNSNIRNKFIELVKDSNKSVAIITTANEDKERGKYVQLAYNDFLAMGFNKIDFIDFENQQKVDLNMYDIFYVAGGNTFKLLKYSRLAHFNVDIINLLKRRGLYIGVSAGSIIIGPDIAIAGCGDNPDLNEVGIENLDGFSVIKNIIYPHYTMEAEQCITDFENKHDVKVVRLSNDQAVLIAEGEQKLIS